MLRALVLACLAVSSCLGTATLARADDRVVSWGFELGAGGNSKESGPYIQRLRDFGFHGEGAEYSGLRYHVAIDRRVLRYFAVGVDLTRLDTFDFARDDKESRARLVPATFSWDTAAASVYGRVGYPVMPEIYPFFHLGVGAAWANSELELQNQPKSEHTQWGPMATVGVGLQLTSPNAGVSFAYLHTFASPLHNELGDRQESGGSYWMISLRIQLLETGL
jgi:hypothetical protein